MPLQPEDIADYSLCGIETVSCQHCRFSSNEYCTGFFYDYKELNIYILLLIVPFSHENLKMRLMKIKNHYGHKVHSLGLTD
jgi:hypothetical protein